MLAEQEVAHHQRAGDVEGREGVEFLKAGFEDLQAEDQVEQRSHQEGQPGEGEEPEGRAAEVAQPLCQRQAPLEGGILQQQDLEHALRPAGPLHDEGGEGFRRQPGHHRAVDIDALEALRVQVQRRFGVLGDRGAGDAADRHQVGPAQHGGGTAEERGVPTVQALLDDAVEHLVLARHRVEGSQIVLDRVGVDEEVRGLHQEEIRVLQEMPDGALEDVLGRHVVGIQDQDQVARVGPAPS